jgi:hypothetical protein
MGEQTLLSNLQPVLKADGFSICRRSINNCLAVGVGRPRRPIECDGFAPLLSLHGEIAASSKEGPALS